MKLLEDLASAALRPILLGALDGVRRKNPLSQWVAGRRLRRLNDQLDDLIQDALPCFDPSEQTSFHRVFWEIRVDQNDLWPTLTTGSGS